MGTLWVSAHGPRAVPQPRLALAPWLAEHTAATVWSATRLQAMECGLTAAGSHHVMTPANQIPPGRGLWIRHGESRQLAHTGLLGEPLVVSAAEPPAAQEGR
jgi:hypothetical protein